MPQDFNAIVDAWFNAHLRNGAIARDTDAYNQVFAALPALKSALAGEQPVVEQTSSTE
jgi:hypothetical protein